MFESIDDILLPGLILALLIIVIVDVALATRDVERAPSMPAVQSGAYFTQE